MSQELQRHQLTVLGNGSLQKAVGKYDQQSITLENTMGAAGLLLSVVESESCWSNSTYWDGNQHELPGTTNHLNLWVEYQAFPLHGPLRSLRKEECFLDFGVCER